MRSDYTWLRVRVQGLQNAFAVGAVVEVEAVAGGRIQRRDIRAGGLFLGGEHPEARFGLGIFEGPIHEVRVVFPVTGLWAVTRNVEVEQVLVVAEF